MLCRGAYYYLWYVYSISVLVHVLDEFGVVIGLVYLQWVVGDGGVVVLGAKSLLLYIWRGVPVVLIVCLIVLFYLCHAYTGAISCIINLLCLFTGWWWFWFDRCDRVIMLRWRWFRLNGRLNLIHLYLYTSFLLWHSFVAIIFIVITRIFHCLRHVNDWW